ncbi:HpcH/HpaI aldolase/citrate lyase family protein [Novosphingobium sp.]|uniref:HpcH/HpaI aldolase/citrate lyase family protein n=1 Tax=Novosphingobium sp. TaxID=1874826 RepID=UPI0038B8A182
MTTLRSWLFVPGDSEKKLAKAPGTGADALIIDLEDAVALASKPAARALTAQWLGTVPRRAGTASLWVRINAVDTGLWHDDLAVIVATAPDGIMLPKAAGPDEVALVSDSIATLEARHGRPVGQIGLLPLVSETPRAALTIPTYLTRELPRLRGLTWGAEDLSAELAASRKRDGAGQWTDAFRFVRAQTLLAAHALGVAAIDTLHADFRDEAGLKAAAEAARADGFSGMLAIHPGQVPIINAAFAPTAAELAHAQAIVAAFAANPDVGTLQIDGRMIDQPHLRQARALLGLD